MSRDIPESDWKIFRVVRVAALERFCQRVLTDIERIAADGARSSHERYLEIFKLIERRDDELAVAFDGPRRSRAILQLAAIVSRGLLAPDELIRFTPETRETIERYLSLPGITAANNERSRK